MFYYRYGLILKTTIIVLVVFVLVAIPSRPAVHSAKTLPCAEFIGFTGPETTSANIPFTWAKPAASLNYPQIPRYADLDLRLRLDLRRPPGMEPAVIEIFENTQNPEVEPRLIATLKAVESNNDVQDYYLKIPARLSGKGLSLDFHSNFFKAPSDPRKLSFIFFESELSLPRTHILKLFFPYPFWIAGLALLWLVSGWCLRAGLRVPEVFLLAGMLGFVLATIAPSTFQSSWWLLLVAAGMGLLYTVDCYLQRLGKTSAWLLFGAVGLLILFFLFAPDGHRSDIRTYHIWIESIHRNGLWNIYNNTPSLDYPPLIVYLLWLYSLIVYPLGLEWNDVVWRGFSGLLFLLMLAILYQFIRLKRKEPANLSIPPTRWLLLVGFNAALFYNSVIWGQTDIIPTLLLVLNFYYAWRKKPMAGGITAGLILISKPQAWFVLPLLIWMLVQRCGWKKGILSLFLGGTIAFGMSVFAFGLDFKAVYNYFSSPELAGEYQVYGHAYNFQFLMLGAARVELPFWLSLAGFAAVGLILALILWTTRGQKQPLKKYALGATLLGTACFTFLIKMKERYLLYSLPIMWLATWQERKYRLPFLALCWLQLAHLIFSLQYKGLIYSFYFWSDIFAQDWTQRILALGTLGVFIWLSYLYWQEIQNKPATSKMEEPSLPTEITERLPIEV
ncbi:glycosyltransferase 87 family protein [Candidatus Chlorohelix sp.]|uniref:glycosyltransferase 87 family protein n=1 Tax=Candidatus Chlorohelix sp. TaxID=3139201 RepID=UPI0030432341